jgi:hypothetical protein
MSRPRYSVQVKDSEERADRIASDRDVDGTPGCSLGHALLDRDRAARLARLTRVKRAAGGFFCPVAALNKVRTGAGQLVDLLEMGLGNSALATRSP